MPVQSVVQYNSLKLEKMVSVYARTANLIRMSLQVNAKIVELERSATKLIRLLVLLAQAMKYQQTMVVLLVVIANSSLKMR